MLLTEDDPRPNCQGETDVFFGPEEDGREEVGRAAREDLCRMVCRTCLLRMRCLEEAMVIRDRYGVWGGMGEGERQRFREHLDSEGYAGEVPHGLELVAAMRAFYRKEGREQWIYTDLVVWLAS
jgi:WhiB family redox-sensing transcriptional regulator